jgi:hypothetical protein
MFRMISSKLSGRFSAEECALYTKYAQTSSEQQMFSFSMFHSSFLTIRLYAKYGPDWRAIADSMDRETHSIADHARTVGHIGVLLFLFPLPPAENTHSPSTRNALSGLGFEARQARILDAAGGGPPGEEDCQVPQWRYHSLAARGRKDERSHSGSMPTEMVC